MENYLEDYRLISGSTYWWVSNTGLVFNEKKNIVSKGRLNNGHPTITVLNVSTQTYATRQIKQCVWEAYNGPIPEGMTVECIDTKKENVSLGNLYLVPKISLVREQTRIRKALAKKDKEKDAMARITKTTEEIESAISLEGEDWKTISVDEFQDYRISNFGRIHHKRKYNIMKSSVGVNGHLSLMRQGKNLRIHREVANLFLSAPKDETCVVFHKDGNKKNNHVDNLEWGTMQETIQHAHDTGLSNSRVRHPHKNLGSTRKLTEYQIQKLLEMSTTVTKAEIGRIFDLSDNTVDKIIRNKGYAVRSNVDLMDDISPYDKSMCLNISTSLKEKLEAISDEIKRPLTEIFRHSLMMFVKQMEEKVRVDV